MRGPIIIVLALVASSLWGGFSASADSAPARDPWADWSANARVELEWARGVRADQKAEITLRPELEWKPRGAGWSLRAVGRIRGDAFDRMEPGHPHPSEVSSFSRRLDAGDHVDFELRELVFQAPVGKAHVELGKLQTVWGRADGLKLLDVVNPQDFREFILDDFDESRIPLWTVKVEVPVGPVVAELVFIPDPSFDELPEAGSPFAFTSERLLGRPPAGLPVVIDDVDRPRRIGRDSDAGMRVTGQLGDWDWSAAYLYHWDDRPLLPGTLEIGPAGPQLRITPRYERTHLVGATTTGGFGDLTIRGEIAWRSDRFLPTADQTDLDGVARTGELGYVLGFDWLGIRDTLVSFQVFQSWLLNNRAGLYRDTLDTNLTLLARREFMNERLRVEAIWIHNLNDADGILRPKVSYELRTGLTVWTGIDVFYGRSRGLFGQFDRSDRWVVGVEWGI